MQKIEKLTEAQISKMPEWVEKHIQMGLSTEPADFEKANAAALRAYELLNLKKPMVVLRVGSPFACTVGGALAFWMLKQLKESKISPKVRAQVGDQVWAQVWAQVGDQVGDQVGAQVRAQVGDQVRAQVRAQVWDQVWAQVWAQVRDQVWDQVRAQVRAQVWDQVRAQVGDQVGDQVRAQVWDQVRAQVGDQVRAQVRAQVWDQVRAQVGDQVGDQVRAQVGAQVRAQVRDQVRDQVRAQVWDQVRAQVGDQVRAQVGDQVWDQVGAQVRAQVGDQVGDQVRAQVRALAKDGISNNYGGQLYHANWVAFVTFMRDVVGVEVHKKFSIESDLAESCGWVWWHENVLAISDRPKLIQRDDRGRLHSETGPAIAYRDGWALHFWHGVSIPPEWIEKKASLTPQMALGWSNVEQRRAACEILGWSHILCELDAKVIDKDADEEIGTLVEVNLPDAGKQKFLQVRCGTGRQFALPVPREMKTAKQSNAWTYGLDTSEFKPEVRT